MDNQKIYPQAKFSVWRGRDVSQLSVWARLTGKVLCVVFLTETYLHEVKLPAPVGVF